jgi:hypothetical protein
MHSLPISLCIKTVEIWYTFVQKSNKEIRIFLIYDYTFFIKELTCNLHFFHGVKDNFSLNPKVHEIKI